ncbi:MAG: outer membrane lipoprotein-sorting protein [Planctomycetes bacterium]|nr:outer membrane lipoprotein-sorting protein [Planctomycetota bacterium]
MPLDTARKQKVDRRTDQGFARTSIAVLRKGVAPPKSEAPAAGDAIETHIYFDCPECDKRMRVRSALAGKRGACPLCQARIVFPDEAQGAGQPNAPSAPAKKPGFSGLRNAVIGSSPAVTPPAKPAPAAPKPTRGPRVSGERAVVESSQSRPSAVQLPAQSAESTDPVLVSELPGESARVFFGTVLGLLVGIFAGFIIGKNFAPARENLSAEAPAANVSHEASISADVAPQEASSFETEDLRPSITEKAPEPSILVAAASKQITETPAERALHSADTTIVNEPEPTPAEEAVEEVRQSAADEPIPPVVAKQEAPALPPVPPVIEAKAVPAPAHEVKIEAPAKGEQAPEIAATPTPETEQPAPPVEDSAPQSVVLESSASSGTELSAASSLPPEPQAALEQPEPAKPETKSEPVKVVPGRPVFTSAREVHDYVDKRYQGDDGKYKLTLTLINKRGEDRTSQMVRYRHERDHLSKVLLTYVSPADVRGTTTMTIEQKDADDIQRIYIPSMKKNRRIASSDKGRSWAGTDFTYEDLQEHEVDDWSYGELKTDIVDGHECYFYVTTPVTPDKSCYTRIENWVRKDILEPVRVKYWDEKGKYLKELNFRDLRKIQGIWSAMYWEMENVQEGHKTVFRVEKVIYNTGLKEDMFTPRSMVDVPLDF